MLRRILFIFLALAITVPFSSLLNSPNANAWTGTLPTCGANLSATFVTNMDAADPGWENLPYVVYQRAFLGTQTEIDIGAGASSQQSFLKEASGEYQLILPSADNVYDVNGDGSVGLRATGTGWGFTDVTCVQAAHLVNYQSSWDVPHYADSYTGVTAPPPLYATCSSLDFACYYGNVMAFFGVVGTFISNFFTNIGNNFTALSTALATSVTSLFIPTANHMGDTFTALGTFFQAKFGFLSWPITFIANFLTAFTTYDNIDTCASTTAYAAPCVLDLSAPAGIIPGYSINFGVIEQHWPSLWSYLQIMLDGVTVLGLVIAIYHKYMRIIKS